MPRAMDEFQIAHHDRVTRRGLIDDGATTQAPRAQRSALVRAVVRNSVEGSVDVVDPHTMASDRHQLVGTRRDLVYCRNNMLAALGEAGLGPFGFLRPLK